MALALLAVPVITRTTEDVLLLQAATLREAGVALGAPLSFVIRTVLWRSARSGLLTGALLAFARISGETAPLLFTALNNQFFIARPAPAHGQPAGGRSSTSRSAPMTTGAAWPGPAPC